VITLEQAMDKANAHGATPVMIEQSAMQQRHNCRSTATNNMIKALQMHPWHNTRDDWTRLAGALLARKWSRTA
jgi:hypothetical protein